MDFTITYDEKYDHVMLEVDIQDDEELFDIDLGVVDNIPPPDYQWDHSVLSTRSALLANCLLPVSDLSSAVPVVSGELTHHFPMLRSQEMNILCNTK
ncbi:unnamed protein product [Amaranthus hypochondriacus]